MSEQHPYAFRFVDAVQVRAMPRVHYLRVSYAATCHADSAPQCPRADLFPAASQGRTFFMEADSEEERDSWVHALGAMIDSRGSNR